MDSTTKRDYDDELAQQAPLVPDIGRPAADRFRTRSTTSRIRRSGTRSPTPDDELAQEAPLVPHLGRIDATQETTDATTDNR